MSQIYNDPYCIGNVLRILDNRTIIVNIGASNISRGKKIQVYEIVDTVTDLDGNDLDLLLYIKDTLEVTQVEKNYSICQKTECREKNITFTLSPLLEKKIIEEYIPLNIDEQDIRPITPNEPLVRVGDPVKYA